MPDTTKKTETKIVKAQPRKDSGKDANASKVEIKAVDIAIIEAQKQRAKKAQAAARKPAQPAQTKPAQTQTRTQAAVPPAAKPMPKSSSSASSGPASPFGKPMPKRVVPQGAVPLRKSEVAQNQKEEAKPEEAAKPAETEEIRVSAPESPAPVQESEKAPVKEAEKPAQESEPQAQPFEYETGQKLKIISKAEPEAPKPEKKAKKAAEEKAEEKAEKPAKKAAKPAKKEEKAPEKEAEPEQKKSEDKPEAAEEPKKAEPEQKKAEEKPADPVNYTPGIGVKIIRRAADEPAPERKPVQPKKNTQKKDAKPQGRNAQQSKDGTGKPTDRKPKEFTGRKPQSSQQGSSAPGRAASFSNQPAAADRSGKGGKKDFGKKGKEKDKDKRDYMMDEVQTDLSRTIKKKHSKYKERAEVGPTAEEELMMEAAQTGSYVINVPITVAGFCEQIEKTTSEAIMALMKMGIMANINQNLDEETAVLLGMELGVNVMVNKAEEIEEEEGIDKSEDRESDLKPRAPIVTVMGHVDHGKTSLLDAIRSTNVTAGEAGGITQHIGASEIEVNGQHIVFLDTPGHEAFTAMRARGAHVTDIAVLVVAADDSVMPQTIESISHAKAAGVPIIVAINKMDKPGANPDRVKTDLSQNGILVEDWGGDVISVPVSAKTGMGIHELLEMILLQAEVLDLKANPDRLASGTVIEARLDKTRGPVATLLIMNGTLQAGAAIVAGTAAGRVRVMTNPKGEIIKKAGPARAVEITGLTDVPEAGDEFYMVKDERTAREISEKRKEKLREDIMAKSSAVSLEKLFSQISEGDVKELNLIVKADVQGSVGALEQSLEKLHNENVRVRIIHSGVGTINESDVVLAGTSNAVIIGFNVRPSTAVQAMADQQGVEIRTYRIIYEIIDDIEAAMKGMLDPEFKEVILGKVEVRTTYKISNVGTIAGAYVTEGKITRNAKIRVVRDGIVIHEGEIASLKRFKDDAREVAQGFECGIGIEKFNDIKDGDIFEAYEMQEIKRD